MKDSVAKLGLERRRGHEIHLMADEFAKLALQADEFKEANRSVEFNEPNCRRYMPRFPARRRSPGRKPKG